MTYAPEWKKFTVGILCNTVNSDEVDRDPESIIQAIRDAVARIGEGGEITFNYGFDGDVSLDYELARLETQEEADERERQDIRSRTYREQQERAALARLKARYEGKP